MASTTQGNLGEKKMDQARDNLNQAKENLKEAAAQGKEAAAQAARDLGQKAQKMASNLGQRAQDTASSVQDKADSALSTVGQKVSGIASSLRSSAPQEGMVGSTASALADRLDSTGRYLQDHGVSDISKDLTGIVKSYPIPSLLAVFGVGFLAGMAARR
jgi:F0F1-type ATP synthase membrane subunit b/b'